MHPRRMTPAVMGFASWLSLSLLMLGLWFGLPGTASAQADTKARVISYLLGQGSDPTGLDRNGDGKVDIADVLYQVKFGAPLVTSFAIAGGAATTASRTVTLDNACQDGPLYYMASESADFAGATWQAYATAPTFQLGPGNLTKRVYFKVKGANGVESAVASDTIDLLEIGALTVGAANVTGTIDLAGDTDWFQFIVTTPSSYAIDTASGTLAGTSLSLYGPDSMTTLVVTDDNTGTADAATVGLTLNPGTYYVKVQANSAGGVGTYTIKVANLGALKVNSFMLAGGATLAVNRAVTLDNACTGRPTEYLASESSSFKDASWQPYATAPAFTLSSGDGVKKVYFKVRDASKTESAVVNDSISLQEMTPLPADGSLVSGEISSGDEEDWYTLTITTGALYTIQTYAGSLGDTMMGLANKPDPSSTEWLAKSDNISDSDPTSRITRWLAPGTYYVMVISGDATTTGDYTIRAWASSNATLSINGPAVSGNIASETDVNWFQFTITTAGLYSIASTAGGMTDGYMELYASDFSEIALNDDRTDNHTYMPAITASLAAGTYIVRMTSAYDLGSYTIKVYSGAISGGTVSLMINGPVTAGSIGAPPSSSTVDSDKYQLIVNTAGSYTVATTAGSLKNGLMSLWNSDGDMLTSVGTGSGMPKIQGTFQPGVYEIIFRGCTTSDQGSYKIQVTQ